MSVQENNNGGAKSGAVKWLMSASRIGIILAVAAVSHEASSEAFVILPGSATCEQTSDATVRDAFDRISKEYGDRAVLTWWQPPNPTFAKTGLVHVEVDIGDSEKFIGGITGSSRECKSMKEDIEIAEKRDKKEREARAKQESARRDKQEAERIKEEWAKRAAAEREAQSRIDVPGQDKMADIFLVGRVGTSCEETQYKSISEAKMRLFDEFGEGNVTVTNGKCGRLECIILRVGGRYGGNLYIPTRKSCQEYIKPNKEAAENYVAFLWKNYSSRLNFASKEAEKAVLGFNIDCRAKDGRYVPLVNILLVNANTIKNFDMSFYIKKIGGTTRIYSELRKDGKQVYEPSLSFEINEWGELRPYGGVTTSGLLSSCTGAHGKIWVAP